MRTWVVALVVIGCDSGRASKPPPSPSPSPAPVVAADAAIADVDAAAPGLNDKVEIPDDRQRPTPITGPSIALTDGQTAALAGIAFTYKVGGGGAKQEGGRDALVLITASRGGKSEKLGFGYDAAPGGIAEGAAFGQGFEVTLRGRGGDIQITLIGKASRDVSTSCLSAIERGAKAVGLVLPPRHEGDMRTFGYSGNGTGTYTSREYSPWLVHCAEQTGRVWFSRQSEKR